MNTNIICKENEDVYRNIELWPDRIRHAFWTIVGERIDPNNPEQTVERTYGLFEQLYPETPR
jgi:hypothetical protein